MHMVNEINFTDSVVCCARQTFLLCIYSCFLTLFIIYRMLGRTDKGNQYKQKSRGRTGYL